VTTSDKTDGRRSPPAGLLLALTVLVPVLHIAHATGLRNTLAALISAWGFALLVRMREYPPLLVPIIVWLVLAAASAFWSPHVELTLKSVLTEIVLPMGVLWAAYLTCRQAQAFRMLCIAVAFGAAILAVLTLLAFATGLSAGLEFEDRAGLIYYYPGPGVASTLCVYALPFALLLCASAARSARFVGRGAAACVLIAGLGSMNRIFWVSLVVTLAVFYLWQWNRLGAVYRKVVPFLLIASTVGAVGVIGYLTEARGFVEIAKDTRLAGWQEWTSIAGDAPFLGHGFGKRSLREGTQARLSSSLVERDRNMRSHGHNVLLDVVIQLGVIGLVVFGALLVALGRKAHEARDEARLPVGAALAALVAGMLIKNMTDDFMDLAGVVAFWGYAGILLGGLAGAPRTTG
jgi:O-antigen ligase